MESKEQANGGSSTSSYAELRRLIVGADDVGEVLPEAILRRAGRDPQLRQALQPLLEEGIRTSVRKRPEILADALFPIIGAAVRKAVAVALQDMVQTMNQLLEQSVSWRSLEWRIEAIRTGRPFAEIVLLRSLLYRVEQVFLIHKDSGLLLQQRVAESVVL